MSVPQNLIDELRATFLKDVAEKGMDSVHPKDYERVKNSDDWLRRFLMHNENNLDLSLKMLWTSVKWRKDFGTNDINENTVKMDILLQGAFFPLEQDVDGHTIIVFKCKRHTKGSNLDDLKRCVVYWFERLERQTKGKPISIFFDMEGCGLGNMDLEFTQYLIGLFKEYYPYFLNYIIIYEMAWILGAAFKIIKSWLPEKAISKIKQVGKKDVFNWVPKQYALECWGGDNDFVFRFVPEATSVNNDNVNGGTPTVNNSKKVHFLDGSPMSETAGSPTSGESKDAPSDGASLKVTPPDIITFQRQDNELVSIMELQNIDSTHISFKLKTTSPEKFRVKPSAGYLAPGASTTITVTLLSGFQLGGLSKDKFLVMSTAISEKEASVIDLADLWRNTSGRNVHQHRLRCIQSSESTKNGGAILSSSSKFDAAPDRVQTDTLRLLQNCKDEIRSLKKEVRIVWAILVVLVVVYIVQVIYAIRREMARTDEAPYCKYLEPEHP